MVQRDRLKARTRNKNEYYLFHTRYYRPKGIFDW